MIVNATWQQFMDGLWLITGLITINFVIIIYWLICYSKRIRKLEKGEK